MPGMKGARGEGGLAVIGWVGRGDKGGEETGLYCTGGGYAPHPPPGGVIERGKRCGGVYKGRPDGGGGVHCGVRDLGS
jgi:hypothetical protein